jgi:hypothetical protein
LTEPLHVGVRVVADGENVRRKFTDFSLFVDLDLVGGVYWQNLIRINSDENRASVGLRATRWMETEKWKARKLIDLHKSS